MIRQHISSPGGHSTDSDSTSEVVCNDKSVDAEGLGGMQKYPIHLDAKKSRPPYLDKNNSRSRFNLVAIYCRESRDRYEVGVAHMDLRTCALYMCQFIDTPTFETLKVSLRILDPVEILLPDPKCNKECPYTKIMDISSNVCSEHDVMCFDKRDFDIDKGIDLLQYIASLEASNITRATFRNHLCVSASYVLITRVEQIQNVAFAEETVPILFEDLDGRCMIDLQSCLDLKVVGDLGEEDTLKTKTLFSVLNTCVTEGGARTLLSSLLRPSCHKWTISKIQEEVADLRRSGRLSTKLVNLLRHVKNIEFVIGFFVLDDNADDVTLTRRKLLELASLRQRLETLFSIRTALLKAKFDSIKDLGNILLDSGLEEIHYLITDNVDNDIRRDQNINKLLKKYHFLFAVKSDSKLEATRKCFEEVFNEAQSVFEEETAEIENCSLNFNENRGFYYVIRKKGRSTGDINLQEFFNICEDKTTITFESDSLLILSGEAFDLINELLKLSKKFVDGILLQIRKLVPVLYKVSKFISHLDYICALTYYSSSSPTVKPIFSDSFDIVQGRHPILDEDYEAVPNDVVTTFSSNFMLITGPSMSGKTTFMEQVCLLQILAQIGCMVPASYGRFPIVPNILTRLHHTYDIESQYSGLALEISEMTPILKEAESYSLVAIDGLGRSTSYEEGLALCYAVIRQLLRIECYTIFTTDFSYLSRLTCTFSSIENYHFLSRDVNGNEDVPCTNNFLIQKGHYRGPPFSYDLAGARGIPKKGIKNGKKNGVKKRNESSKNNECEDSPAYRRRIIDLAIKIKKYLPNRDLLDVPDADVC